MKLQSVTAQVPEKKDAEGEITQAALGPLQVEVNYPETLDEAKSMFGEEPILSNAFANWRVVIQSAIRSALKRGEAPESIQARLKSAVMGVATTSGRIDAEAAFRAKFASATPQEQKKMIENLRNLASNK